MGHKLRPNLRRLNSSKEKEIAGIKWIILKLESIVDWVIVRIDPCFCVWIVSVSVQICGLKKNISSCWGSDKILRDCMCFSVMCTISSAIRKCTTWVFMLFARMFDPLIPGGSLRLVATGEYRLKLLPCDSPPLRLPGCFKHPLIPPLNPEVPCCELIVDTIELSDIRPICHHFWIHKICSFSYSAA